MTAAADDDHPDTDAPPEEIPCPPCRGSGQVISNAGGASSSVTCPWCEGTGVFHADHDAQAARRADEPAA